jgi:hypothetical protein
LLSTRPMGTYGSGGFPDRRWQDEDRFPHARVAYRRSGVNRHRQDPYAFWTRKIDGKTVTRMHSDVELAELKALFDNARKLRGLTSHLQEPTVELVEPDDTRPRTRSRRVRHWRRTRHGALPTFKGSNLRRSSWDWYRTDPAPASIAALATIARSETRLLTNR